MSRSWLIRRVIWTTEYIYIARKDEENIIDSIPLAEAAQIFVSESDQTGNKGEKSKDASEREPIPGSAKFKSKSKDESKTVDNAMVVQIRTIPEGFNSGKHRVCLHVEECYELNLVAVVI